MFLVNKDYNYSICIVVKFLVFCFVYVKLYIGVNIWLYQEILMGVFYGYVVKKNVLNVYEIRFIIILDNS